MKKITRFSAALFALLTLWSHAAANTTLPLNTGYNYPPGITYAVGAQDLYWINIASHPGGSTAIGPARVIPTGTWAAPLPGSAWISGWPVRPSPVGTTAFNPAYTIFRKCFCLLPDFKDVKLSFSARADDSLQVWLNTQLNQLLAPSPGNPTGPPRTGGTDKGFRVGPNCLYVLVEDQGGAMGFNLNGAVSAAYGLLPTPAVGVAQSYAPCSCRTGHPGPSDAAGPRGAASAQGRTAQAADEVGDGEVVKAILAIAERRRLERQRERQ